VCASSSWPRTQAEAHAGCMGEAEDAGPAKKWRASGERVAAEPVI
jgi:hypothetical protein